MMKKAPKTSSKPNEKESPSKPRRGGAPSFGETREEQDDRELISASEFAQLVGVPLWEIDKRRRMGTFSPAVSGGKGPHDRGSYMRSQVADFQRKEPMLLLHYGAYSGEVASAVFEHLEAGGKLVECVKKFSIHPDIAERIHHAYARLEGGVYLPGDVVKKISNLGLDGPTEITEDKHVYEILKQAAEDTRCAVCKDKRKRFCMGCAVDRHSLEEKARAIADQKKRDLEEMKAAAQADKIVERSIAKSSNGAA